MSGGGRYRHEVGQRNSYEYHPELAASLLGDDAAKPERLATWTLAALRCSLPKLTNATIHERWYLGSQSFGSREEKAL